MNREQKELLETIESLWVSYFEKTQAINEIARAGECLEGRMFDFKGDIPASSLFKFDTVGPRVDKARKIYITNRERAAYKQIMRLPSRLRAFVMLEPLFRKRIDPGKRQSLQRILAAELSLPIKTYQNYRYRATNLLVLIACQDCLIAA